MLQITCGFLRLTFQVLFFYTSEVIMLYEEELFQLNELKTVTVFILSACEAIFLSLDGSPGAIGLQAPD